MAAVRATRRRCENFLGGIVSTINYAEVKLSTTGWPPLPPLARRTRSLPLGFCYHVPFPGAPLQIRLEQPDSNFRARLKELPFPMFALAPCPPPRVRCRDFPGQGRCRGLSARRVQLRGSGFPSRVQVPQMAVPGSLPAPGPLAQAVPGSLPKRGPQPRPSGALRVGRRRCGLTCAGGSAPRNRGWLLCAPAESGLALAGAA